MPIIVEETDLPVNSQPNEYDAVVEPLAKAAENGKGLALTIEGGPARENGTVAAVDGAVRKIQLAVGAAHPGKSARRVGPPKAVAKSKDFPDGAWTFTVRLSDKRAASVAADDAE